MNITQQHIVFLWFVPALGFLVLPLFWSVLGFLYRAVERSRLTDIQGFVELNSRSTDSSVKTELRNRPRIRIDGGSVWIDEERKCCKAFAADISHLGICLRNIPQRMYMDSGQFRAVLRTRRQDYNLRARPVWKKLTEKGFLIGAEINRTPDGWNDFIDELTQSLASKPA